MDFFGEICKDTDIEVEGYIDGCIYNNEPVQFQHITKGWIYLDTD